jgi:hypothetical protein
VITWRETLSQSTAPIGPLSYAGGDSGARVAVRAGLRSLARLAAPRKIVGRRPEGATTIRQVVQKHRGHARSDHNNPDDRDHVLNADSTLPGHVTASPDVPRLETPAELLCTSELFESVPGPPIMFPITRKTSSTAKIDARSTSPIFTIVGMRESLHTARWHLSPLWYPHARAPCNRPRTIGQHVWPRHFGPRRWTGRVRAPKSRPVVGRTLEGDLLA